MLKSRVNVLISNSSLKIKKMKINTQKIGVVGTGYVGLVTGACFSSRGIEVTCFDLNEERINTLSSGEVPFYEPGLEEMVSLNRKEGKLSFSLMNKEKINNVDMIFICVGTPDDGTGKTSMNQIDNAIDFVIKNLTEEKIIVIRSTVPVGTCESIQERIRNESLFNHIVCSNPEFTKEGVAINDFENPDRVIIGCPEDEEVRNNFLNLYKSFASEKNILFMSTESSELTKYSSNAFLATKLSFINDMARFADKVDASISEVAKGMGMDPRIGNTFLNSGIGYGGSCFPKDCLSLLNQASEKGEKLNVLEGVVVTNEYQINYFHKKILDYFESKELKKSITILGLSFKPNTDDIRESRGVLLYNLLLKSDFDIKCYDPMDLKFTDENISYFKNINQAVSDTKALVIAVEDKNFIELDFQSLKEKGLKAIFDGRNILKNTSKDLKGLDYISIG